MSNKKVQQKYVPDTVARKQEFIELLKATGWRQAEAARRLELTRAGVNAIVTGIASPSPMALKLFRIIVAEEFPHLQRIGGINPDVPGTLQPPPGSEKLFSAIAELERQVASVKVLAQKLVSSAASERGRRLGRIIQGYHQPVPAPPAPSKTRT